MTRTDIFNALQDLYPDGFTGGDDSMPSPSSYEEYSAWVKAGSNIHTEQEMTDAAARTVAARAAKRAEVEAEQDTEAKREALLSTVRSMPKLARKKFYRRVLGAVARALDLGDVVVAREIIDEATDVDGLDADTKSAITDILK